MIDLDPKILYQRYQNKEIDKTTLVSSLLLIIEESTYENLRVGAINQLRRLGITSDHLFTFMENLMISDSNDKVRNAAAGYISFLYYEKSYNIVNWAIQYEESYECIITMINILKKMQSEEAKSLLISEISKILNPNNNLTYKPYISQKYRRRIKCVFKKKDINDFSNKDLAEILINFKTLSFLALSFPNFYFDLDLSNGLVSEVDLADYLQYEVKGTPFGWKNNIVSLSKIKGLTNLKFIKKLDLSNNLIEDLSELSTFKNLETIYLANNKISDCKNIEYINSLPKIHYVDLSGNNDFKPNVKVVLKRFDELFEF
ncbi:MAG: leucine-rich repeat domain-containing protein [Candidatus Lokiarchaeota archaeon]